MIAMLQRLCWNSSGWRLPTGSSSEGGYPGEMGFGHEEWNFQTGDACDGNVYGYLYYSPSKQARQKSGGHFQIAFWAFHPETHEKLLVGYYHDATLPTLGDYKRLDAYFRDQGIYDRRANELLAAVPSLGVNRAREEVTNAVMKHWLSFKCPVDKVEVLSDYVPLPDRVQGKSITLRFNRPTHVSEIPSTKELKEITVEEHARIERRTTPLAEDGYYREFGARLKYILPRHNILSNQFSAWLRKKGHTDVRQEKSGVDIEFTSGSDLCRAELKVCYGVGTTKAIREALGQLLEYNYYGNREPAKRWFIILDQQPSSNDRSYVANLRTKVGLPLVLGWQEEPEGFQLLG
jgi:hypothetical protein